MTIHAIKSDDFFFPQSECSETKLQLFLQQRGKWDSSTQPSQPSDIIILLQCQYSVQCCFLLCCVTVFNWKYGGGDILSREHYGRLHCITLNDPFKSIINAKIDTEVGLDQIFLEVAVITKWRCLHFLKI